MTSRTHRGVQMGRRILLSAVVGLLAWSSAVAAAPEGSPWGAKYFPNVVLLNQDGQSQRFYDDLIKNKVVVINFIFTSCKDMCPAETAKLRQVQQLLGDRVGRDIFFYSISIDPENDSPAVMKTYSQKFEVAPGWQFLTGNVADVSLLRTKLGLLRTEDEKEKSDHNTSLIVGNEATGQWMKRSAFDNAQVLAGVVGGWLHNWKVASPGEKRSYAEAVRIETQSHGETLFRTRCAMCHSVGGGDAMGPDLLGVADKRERRWLISWLKAPDRMLAEKDPIALALYAQYRELAMPNLKLNDVDAEALIDYLRAQSKLVVGANK